MSDRSATHAPEFQPAIHVPHQAPPIDRAVSSAALNSDRGIDADILGGVPVGNWLEAPGKYMWENYAKPWLNA
ncbi:hypothetical protein SAMN05660350_04959 [Geodermatophilus obscurus]|uniref:Uncharacterized protein n=1 Tax=Geodermatophilus obscurus TaxID=1861 RepID=A0A1M7V197_9ACTN|nr:hypothetical protein [Geodermatophilus obscurus]SHN88967.1 hypothetical protein SAMN05660350_04959 [Geodermatophilus obscurus]